MRKQNYLGDKVPWSILEQLPIPQLKGQAEKSSVLWFQPLKEDEFYHEVKEQGLLNRDNQQSLPKHLYKVHYCNLFLLHLVVIKYLLNVYYLEILELKRQVINRRDSEQKKEYHKHVFIYQRTKSQVQQTRPMGQGWFYKTRCEIQAQVRLQEYVPFQPDLELTSNVMNTFLLCNKFFETDHLSMITTALKHFLNFK